MPTLVRDLFKSLNVPTLVRTLFKTLNWCAGVSDKIGGDANFLADSHIICRSLNVSDNIGGDAH